MSLTDDLRAENESLRELLKECKNEFNDISTMACYPTTHFTHPAGFDRLFNKCREMIDNINAAIGESEE